MEDRQDRTFADIRCIQDDDASKQGFSSIGLAMALAAGSVAILPRLWGDPTNYAQVVSIWEGREYQDPTLLINIIPNA